MALSLALRSTASAFRRQFSLRPPSVNFADVHSRGLSAMASSVVLVEQNEAEKVGRLKDTYLDKIVPALIQEFNYSNIHQVPKVQKIVVKCGDVQQHAKGLAAAKNDLALITGQTPIKTGGKKAIGGFKNRDDQPPGIACTLRGNMMYSFLDRVINLGLPKTWYFQGASSNSVDGKGKGNYTIGFREPTVFPEINIDVLGKPRALDVYITTTASTDKEAHRLLALMGMPFGEGAGPAGLNVRKKKLKSRRFDSKSKGKSKQKKR